MFGWIKEKMKSLTGSPTVVAKMEM